MVWCDAAPFFYKMDVLDWISKAKTFSSNEFLNDFSYVVMDNENIVDLQRLQWNEGSDYKGRVIGFYKKSTEELSGGRKIAGEPYDLKNTGDFWEKTFIVAIIKGNDIEFLYDSSGIYKKKLFETIQEHGELINPEDIFGLFEPFKNKMIEFLEPIFINQLEKYYSND